jgi:hypothetical protein
MKFLHFFLFLCVIFQFCPPGSGSTDLIESGSITDPNPDPKHCFFFKHSLFVGGQAEASSYPEKRAEKDRESRGVRLGRRLQVIPYY